MKIFRNFFSRFELNPARLSLAGVLVLAAFALPGCGRGAQPLPERPDPTAGGKAPVITVIGGGRQRYWNAAREGALDAGKEFGADIQWKNPTAANIVPQQSRFVAKAVSDNVSGIVVAPLDRTELATHINKAGKNRIPAVVFALPVYTKFILSGVTTDYHQAGVLAARRAGSVTNGQGTFGVLSMPGDSPAIESVRGFKETLSKEFPSAQVREVANIDSQNLDVLFLPEDTLALSALKTRKPSVRIITISAEEELADAVESGALDALMVPDYHRMTYESVRAIVQFRAHEAPPKKIGVPAHLVTKETIKEPETRQRLGLDP